MSDKDSQYQPQRTKTQISQSGGVTFDHKLDWLPHLQKTKEKIASNVARLSRIQGKNWGVRETTMKKIYKTIIEKQITNGAEIW